MIICFTINITSIGSINRYEVLKNFNNNNFFSVFFVSNYILYKKYVIISLFKNLLISFPIGYIIISWIKNISIKRKHLIIYGLLLNIIILLYNLPITFILNDIGGARVYLILSILLGIYSLFVAIYVINYTIKINKMFLSRYMSFIFALTLLLVSFYYTIIHYNYSISYDKRISYLINLKNTKNYTEIIELNALPPSGLLRSGDIGTNENEYENLSLKRYIGLKQKLKIKGGK